MALWQGAPDRTAAAGALDLSSLPAADDVGLLSEL